MRKTYQPFIIELCDEVFEEIKDDINPIERNKEILCDLLTQKFIDGELSAGDKQPFDSEKEVDNFIMLCWINDNLCHLQKLGLIGTFNDGETFFLTEAGKRYINLL